MKQNYATFILFFCLAAFLHSQNFAGNWNVVSLISNGSIINSPSTATTPPNINFDSFYSSPPAGPFDQYWGHYINGNGICNPFTSYFETSTDAITLIPYFETSTNICSTIEETDFENLFFEILQQSGNLDYSFSNNLYNLSFTNSLGETINLSREDATTNVLSGEWFIHSIWDNDILFENTLDPNLNIIFSEENINGQSTINGSSTCNGFNASYDTPIQTSSLIIRHMSWTLLTCGTTEEYIESAYINFFNTYDEDIYTFEIIGSGVNSILHLNNGYGSTITYGRQALSIDNFSKQKTQLITDLTENKLQLISETILANTKYTIYDISGRCISSSHLNQSKSITINTLASGVYFLNIMNSKNQTERFKFLKK